MSLTRTKADYVSCRALLKSQLDGSMEGDVYLDGSMKEHMSQMKLDLNVCNAKRRQCSNLQSPQENEHGYMCECS
jgi:hypothetical protein